MNDLLFLVPERGQPAKALIAVRAGVGPQKRGVDIGTADTGNISTNEE
jgi:hypothetical protein